MASTRRTLDDQLGRAPGAAIRALPEQQRQVLADALADARRQQAVALSAAGEKALSYVPSLLRGAVRRAAGL